MRALLLATTGFALVACGAGQPPVGNQGNISAAHGNLPTVARDNETRRPLTNEVAEAPKAVNWSTKPLKRYSAELDGVKYSVDLPDGYRLVEKRRGRGANEHLLHVYEYKVEHPWGPEIEVWVWKKFSPRTRVELDKELPPDPILPPGETQPSAERWVEGKAFVDGEEYLGSYRGTIYFPGATHTLVFSFSWRPKFPEEPGADLGKNLFKRVAKSLRLE